MAFLPDDSAIRVDSDLERKLETATHAEILQALHDAAEQQGLAARDPFNGQLYATPLADNAPKVLTRILNINGVRHVLEGASEAELSAAEAQMWRTLQAQPDDREQQREENGRFAGRPDIEDPVIAGQVEGYLRRRGVDPADLAQVAGRGYVARWSDASDSFRERHPEYEGNERNMKLIGGKLIELGLEDSPSLESLERAYTEVARTGSLSAPQAELANALASATNVEDIRELSRRSMGLPTSSGVFAQ